MKGLFAFQLIIKMDIIANYTLALWKLFSLGGKIILITLFNDYTQARIFWTNFSIPEAASEMLFASI